jgi:16S rRNA (cytidine1402-2'-O)-methyltransferase
MGAGKLFLIPSLLGESDPRNIIPEQVREIAISLEDFIVENEKSARHYLKKLGIQKPLEILRLYPLNEHTDRMQISSYLKPLLEGRDMGIISEAGCPGVADPGAEIVRLAHEKDIPVIPLVGPSSILLALMASGLNGQSFAFLGYLPRERSARIKRIQEIEKESYLKKQSQIFIEAPYRNSHLLEDLLLHCDKHTRLCIAADITTSSEYIKTRSVGEWKKNVPDIHKRPAIFIIQK